MWYCKKFLLFIIVLLLNMNQAVAKRVIDQMYPGTAVARMNAARLRAKSLNLTNIMGGWIKRYNKCKARSRLYRTCI